ncbi:hypothetical protein SDC9_207362 [bioreactor metagenome]|uniref:Uncharacterized protein n=1 Tax=bioreactor metagenome TaxID=1076179 RepID=A0A645J7P8_9ZZZZ
MTIGLSSARNGMGIDYQFNSIPLPGIKRERQFVKLPVDKSIESRRVMPEFPCIFAKLPANNIDIHLLHVREIILTKPAGPHHTAKRRRVFDLVVILRLKPGRNRR